MREYMEQLQAALILGWASIALGLWVQGLDFQNAQNKQVLVAQGVSFGSSGNLDRARDLGPKQGPI